MHTFFATAVKEFVKSKLADYKRLRGGVQFMDVIPKSASGKILRRVRVFSFLVLPFFYFLLRATTNHYDVRVTADFARPGGGEKRVQAYLLRHTRSVHALVKPKFFS